MIFFEWAFDLKSGPPKESRFVVAVVSCQLISARTMISVGMTLVQVFMLHLCLPFRICLLVSNFDALDSKLNDQDQSEMSLAHLQQLMSRPHFHGWQNAGIEAVGPTAQARLLPTKAFVSVSSLPKSDQAEAEVASPSLLRLRLYLCLPTTSAISPCPCCDSSFSDNYW